jgi:hypothetical protein
VIPVALVFVCFLFVVFVIAELIMHFSTCVLGSCYLLLYLLPKKADEVYSVAGW